MQALPGNNIGNDLGIAGGVEDTSLQLELTPKLIGVHQVAVMTDGQLTLDVLHQHGLCIFPGISAAGRVTHMAHGDFSLSQGLQLLCRENLMDKSAILVALNHTIMIHRNTGGLLSSVLQCCQSVILQLRKILIPRRPNTKDSTLLMYFLCLIVHSDHFLFVQCFSRVSSMIILNQYGVSIHQIA